MATRQVDVQVIELADGKVRVIARRTDNDTVVDSVIRAAKIQTAGEWDANKLAIWLIHREWTESATRNDALTRRLTVTFDADEMTVSDVIVERSPKDAALRALPTAEEVRAMTALADLREALALVIEALAADNKKARAGRA